MNIRNRIVAHENADVSQIIFNANNWRVHPKFQKDSLESVLKRVGWVKDVIINSTTGNLIDGHLRCLIADANHEKTVPATIVELSEEEEKLMLASLDPISQMAVADKEKLQELMLTMRNDDEAIERMMQEIAKKEKLAFNEREGLSNIEEQYMILVECQSEEEQASVLQQLTEKGISCRALIS